MVPHDRRNQFNMVHGTPQQAESYHFIDRNTEVLGTQPDLYQIFTDLKFTVIFFLLSFIRNTLNREQASDTHFIL